MTKFRYFILAAVLFALPAAYADDFTTQQEALLADARADLAARPDDPDALIWVGRRLAYLGRYDEAIATYQAGIAQHPDDARFLRHLGHRFITMRNFDSAMLSLQEAADMMAGRPNAVEPDGLPNDAGIPTSTLKGNIYYHLALAYYLSGDFEAAAQGFAGAAALAANPDSAAASRYWLYLSNMRAGHDAAAARAIAPVAANWALIENFEYQRLILCFQEADNCAPLLAEAAGADGVSSGTLLYGLAMQAEITGDSTRAARLRAQLLALDERNSFGFIAAEADARRGE